MNDIVPELSVDSVTGIDVSLAVAGAGARSFAFIIDWFVRLVLALAWYALGAFVYNRGLSIAAPLTNDAAWFGAVVTPALAIYFLYHYAVELAMRGRTPGKRTAGIRIVARDGSAPGAGALLVRNVFRLIDTLPVLYCLGLVAVIATREHLRVGDMAAGTLLVYERDAAHLPPAAEAPRLDARASELVAELLERWPTLAPDARLQLGQQLLARYGGGAAAADESALRGALTVLLHGTAGAPP
ncbi:MAG TPA: RDD family protein [Steroidobacteraceae bacterium]